MHKTLFSRYLRFSNTIKNGSSNSLKFLKNRFIFSLLTGSVLTQGFKYTMDYPRFCQGLAPQTEQGNRVSFPEEFSEEKYEEAIKNKCNIVILWDPEKYVENFQNELLDFISSLEYFQISTKGRKMKVFTFKPKNGEEVKKFQEKYKIEVGDDTLLLLKSKYLKGFYQFDAEHYFQKPEFIYKYFRRLQKLNQKQVDDFSSSLEQLNSDSKILVCYIPRSSPNYKGLRNRFAVLSLENSLSENKNLHFLILSDKETAHKYNITPQKEGELFLFSKSNKYNHFSKSVSLKDRNFSLVSSKTSIESPLDEILISLSKIYRENYVFTSPSFDHVPTRYSLVLEVDNNRITKQEYNRCIEAFSQLHSELKNKEQGLFSEIGLVRINRKRTGSVFNVFLRDEKLTMEELNKSQQKGEVKETEFSKSHSYIYEFPEGELLSKENLLTFLKKVKENQIPEKFKSQMKPKYQRFSKKIVSETFDQEILKSEKDQVLFFFSKHCHACKTYGGHYEELALENLRNPQSTVEYNRMNSDLNTLANFPNFHYTPIFMVIRKEAKTKPLVYKSQHFTPSLLKNFIDVSLSQSFVSRDDEKKMLKNIGQGKTLMKDWKIHEGVFNKKT